MHLRNLKLKYAERENSWQSSSLEKIRGLHMGDRVRFSVSGFDINAFMFI